MDTERRRFLAAVGGTAASAAAMAGCLEAVPTGEEDSETGEEDSETDESDGDRDETDTDDGETEPTTDGAADPIRYRNWLPDADEPVAFAYVDWEKAMELDGDSDDDDGDDADEGENEGNDEIDPMLGIPLAGTDRIVPASVGTDIEEADLIPLVHPDSAEADDFDSTVTGLLAVNDCSVIIGDLEPEEIGDRLTAEPEYWYPVRFEHVEEIGDYDVYYGVDRENRVAAVGEDAIVFRRGEGAQAAVRRLLDARREGDVTDVDTETDASWLVETGGGGHLAFGGYGGPPAMEVQKIGVEPESYDVAAQYDALSDVEGVVAALELDTVDDEATGSFAAVFADDADVDADLAERLGSSATERSVETDGRRVSATARWTRDDENSPLPGS